MVKRANDEISSSCQGIVRGTFYVESSFQNSYGISAMLTGPNRQPARRNIDTLGLYSYCVLVDIEFSIRLPAASAS